MSRQRAVVPITTLSRELGDEIVGIKADLQRLQDDARGRRLEKGTRCAGPQIEGR